MAPAGRGDRKAGGTVSQPDLIIAAAGLHHGRTDVRHDTGDHARAQVLVFTPWVDLPIGAVVARSPALGNFFFAALRCLRIWAKLGIRLKDLASRS